MALKQAIAESFQTLIVSLQSGNLTGIQTYFYGLPFQTPIA